MSLMGLARDALGVFGEIKVAENQHELELARIAATRPSDRAEATPDENGENARDLAGNAPESGGLSDKQKLLVIGGSVLLLVTVTAVVAGMRKK